MLAFAIPLFFHFKLLFQNIVNEQTQMTFLIIDRVEQRFFAYLCIALNIFNIWQWKFLIIVCRAEKTSKKVKFRLPL